jgi:hypothetical protein
MTDYKEKVKEWLLKSGYPMEMEIAKGLEEAGFGISQSDYFEDSDTGKWRETDVIAYEQAVGDSCRAIFSLVTECKGAKDKPWVLFTSNDSYPQSLSVSRRVSNEYGESILRVLALKYEVKNSLLFELPKRPGYSLTAAKINGGNEDAAFHAVNSVCKASLGLAKKLSNVHGANIIPFVWPVMVINSQLFESYLSSDGELQLEPIEKGLLIWRNPILTTHSLIQIYTKDYFLKELSEIRECAVKFLEAAVSENDRAPRNNG